MSAAAVERHTPEWDELRSRGIGGSEIAIVAGLAPESRGSRWELHARKTGRLPRSDESSELMDLGTDLEEWLAWKFTKHTGMTVAGEHMMVLCPGRPEFRCELDCLAFDGRIVEPSIDLALGVVETKFNPGASAWTTERCDSIIVPPELHDLPPHVTCQVQWQLLCTGLDRAWVAALHSRAYRIYPVARDQALIDALVKAGAEFWDLVERYRAGDESAQPALGGPGRDATAAALAQVFGEGGGGEVDIDHLAEQREALVLLKAEAKALDEQIVDLENEVKGALGEAEVGLIDGLPLVTWKRTNPGLVFDRTWHEVWAPDCHQTFTVRREPQRRLDVRVPCPHCPKALRPQDVASHLKKHPEAAA